jgi:hypothetical protein
MGKVGRKRSLMSSVLRTLASLMLLLGPVRAQDVVVGVNVVNPMRASVADQNAVLSQLEAPIFSRGRYFFSVMRGELPARNDGYFRLSLR